MRVGFVHPDLGIGGAERLVVDAAVGLKKKGHAVKFYTSHHDPNHAFEETKSFLDVEVIGDFLPRGIFGGRLHIVFAVLRSIFLALVLTFRVLSGATPRYDVLFVDQISVHIPLLRLCCRKVVFYCHFPDLLLAKRSSLVRKIYRLPFDLLEEFTTSMADCLLVNSKFTGSVFKKTFQWLGKRAVPDVLYPPINVSAFDEAMKQAKADVLSEDKWKPLRNRICFMSLNRYERKKNVGICIRALAILRDKLKKEDFEKVQLVIAGGYDERVRENVEVYQELKAEAERLGITDKVSFYRSISTRDKSALLLLCRGLVYTPSGEHFGIVPVESMAAKRPCIAVNDGGPLESIVDEQTGYHCPPNPEAFAAAMARLVNMNDRDLRVMGEAGRARVEGNFSLEAFADRLEHLIGQLVRPNVKKRQ